MNFSNNRGIVRDLQELGIHRRRFFACLAGLSQEGIELVNDFEGVGDIEHIGLAASPSAVGIEIDGTPLGDETPANCVWLFAVTTCERPLGWRALNRPVRRD